MKQLKWLAICLLAWACSLFPAPALGLEVVAQRLETEGTSLGIDQQGYYLYLADGERGLKIINVSNRRYFVLTGTLPLDGMVTDVAVDSYDEAVLIDAAGRQIYFVDLSDKTRPELMSTLPSTGGVPRIVRKIPGMAFVVEYADDPSAPGAFSGVEVFSHWPRAESVQVVPIEGLRDIVVTGTHLLAAADTQLLAFRRTASGIETSPETALDFPAGDTLQSLAVFGQHLFIFGTENLSVTLLPLRPVLPPPRIPGLLLPGLPEPRISDPARGDAVPIELTILAQAPVETDRDNRRVDATVLDIGDGLTSQPLIFILLTTRNAYGLFNFNRSTNALNPVSYEDLDLAEHIVFKDIHEATDGRISIYDAAFSRYPHPGIFKEGIMAVGALGENGLGYVHYEY